MSQPGLEVSFRTFGCRLNQTETEAIAAAFAAAGATIVVFDHGADIVVFNTCTVTGKAEQKARREMRLALRRNPAAVIMVTGCYAELDPVALASLSPRLVVLPGGRKDALLAMATELVAAAVGGLDLLDEARRLSVLARGHDPTPFAFQPGDFRFHARASLKVQDGCDNRCAYCRVCLARGKATSLDAAEVLRRARVIGKAGLSEIVLTGVNLSQYRSDCLDFSGLLQMLVRETSAIAYRVSSYEPDRIDAAFLSAFALQRVRPHLHLPVQSGSDAVLLAMGRAYDSATVLDAVAAARLCRDDPFIGVDIIAGFPGESDADFAATVALLRQLEPAWIHAFKFSPRPGTKAFSMRPCVPERVAAERAAILDALAWTGRRRFAERRMGRILAVIPDDSPAAGAGSAPPGCTTAVSADYLRVRVHGVPGGTRGSFSCLVTGVAESEHVDLDASFLQSTQS